MDSFRIVPDAPCTDGNTRVISLKSGMSANGIIIDGEACIQITFGNTQMTITFRRTLRSAATRNLPDCGSFQIYGRLDGPQDTIPKGVLMIPILGKPT